jgi:hypothetical protein
VSVRLLSSGTRDRVKPAQRASYQLTARFSECAGAGRADCALAQLPAWRRAFSLSRWPAISVGAVGFWPLVRSYWTFCAGWSWPALKSGAQAKSIIPGPNGFPCGVGFSSVTSCTAAGSLIAMLASLGA